MTGSIALVADAVHTLSDVVTSLLVIAGFWLAARPPDSRHPFGHGRSEKVVAVVMATLLCITGYEFFVASLSRLRHPTAIRAGATVIVVLLVSALLKEWLYHVSYELYRVGGYDALKVDAWHHRSDAFATLMVLAGFIAFRFGWHRLDGVLGIGVSGLIAWTGVGLIFESASFLLGEAPHPETESKVRAIIAQLGGRGIHHIHIHDYAGRQEITVHIRMQQNETLEHVHQFCSLIEDSIRSALPGAQVTVHCEPESSRTTRG